ERIRSPASAASEKIRSFWTRRLQSPAPWPCIPAQPSRCLSLDILDLRLKPPSDAADAEDALLSQPSSLYPQSYARLPSFPPASSIDQLAIVGFSKCGWRRRCPRSASSSSRPGTKQQAAEDDREATEAGISQTLPEQPAAAAWFSSTAEAVPPGTADTPPAGRAHRSLSYPQVRSGSPNSAMRTNNSLRAAARRCASAG
uniref:Os01g0778700 protein n=1 Tax=Macrostomum lignano TaxID=282301 RepID=A0A1I8FEW3_9PLAT